MGASGVRPIIHDYRVVWLDENDQPGHLDTLSDSIITRFVEEAQKCDLAPAENIEQLIEQAEVRAKEAYDLRMQQVEETEKKKSIFREEAKAKTPAWAKAVIIADQVEDQSDMMTDYHGGSVTRTLILGFSKHTRDIFSEMRKAALNSKETADLFDAPEEAEHREKHSMGGGYYLKHGSRYATGWRISKSIFYAGKGSDSIPVGEWSLPEVSQRTPSNGSKGGIQEHTHTKRGVQMFIVLIPGQVEREEFNRLREVAKDMGGWYSRKWGTTPGGFAFKILEEAETFQREQFGDSPPPPSKPDLSEKFNDLADSMQKDIDHLLGDRLENTPKRRLQADSARLEGHHLERTQEALRVLAGLHESGGVPEVLTGILTKKAVYENMRSEHDCTYRGYYQAPVDTGNPVLDTPEAKALWGLIQEQTVEERAKDELNRKIKDLQFRDIPGYYPTPEPIIKLMVERAGNMEGQTVLEPSAGAGAISNYLLNNVPDICLGVYEIRPALRDILEAQGRCLLGDGDGDFLKSGTNAKWSRIIMNPPFENLQDVDHVRHAYDLLENGGRLVAIMSQGAFFKGDRKAGEFREWFEELGGKVEDLPEGSFKASGTGVASKLVVIDKE
ncbi:MAG: class I SAM-dependent methyltransferase [Nitrospinae bacterium]|nr:class I SAM-dependent methyltransferase [Nitrospinota bacterium]